MSASAATAPAALVVHPASAPGATGQIATNACPNSRPNTIPNTNNPRSSGRVMPSKRPPPPLRSREIMPRATIAKISGTRVIFSAFSQSVPSG